MPKRYAIVLCASFCVFGCSTTESTEEAPSDGTASESSSDSSSVDVPGTDSSPIDDASDSSGADTTTPLDADFSDTAGFPDVPAVDGTPPDSGPPKCGACAGGCYFTAYKFCQEGSGSTKASCDLGAGTFYPGTCPGACPKAGKTGGCQRVSPEGCTVVFWHYDSTTVATDKSSCTKTCPAGHSCTWIAP